MAVEVEILHRRPVVQGDGVRRRGVLARDGPVHVDRAEGHGVHERELGTFRHDHANARVDLHVVDGHIGASGDGQGLAVVGLRAAAYLAVHAALMAAVDVLEVRRNGRVAGVRNLVGLHIPVRGFGVELGEALGEGLEAAVDAEGDRVGGRAADAVGHGGAHVVGARRIGRPANQDRVVEQRCRHAAAGRRHREAHLRVRFMTLELEDAHSLAVPLGDREAELVGGGVVEPAASAGARRRAGGEGLSGARGRGRPGLAGCRDEGLQLTGERGADGLDHGHGEGHRGGVLRAVRLCGSRGEGDGVGAGGLSRAREGELAVRDRGGEARGRVHGGAERCLGRLGALDLDVYGLGGSAPLYERGEGPLDRAEGQRRVGALRGRADVLRLDGGAGVGGRSVVLDLPRGERAVLEDRRAVDDGRVGEVHIREGDGGALLDRDRRSHPVAAPGGAEEIDVVDGYVRAGGEDHLEIVRIADLVRLGSLTREEAAFPAAQKRERARDGDRPAGGHIGSKAELVGALAHRGGDLIGEVRVGVPHEVHRVLGGGSFNWRSGRAGLICEGGVGEREPEPGDDGGSGHGASEG